jgi:hypothetical protein
MRTLWPPTEIGTRRSTSKRTQRRLRQRNRKMSARCLLILKKTSDPPPLHRELHTTHLSGPVRVNVPMFLAPGTSSVWNSDAGYPPQIVSTTLARQLPTAIARTNHKNCITKAIDLSFVLRQTNCPSLRAALLHLGVVPKLTETAQELAECPRRSTSSDNCQAYEIGEIVDYPLHFGSI